MSSPPVQLGFTDGAELIATFVSIALWGTTCMQTLIYFIRYPKDQVVFKVLVVWLWVIDTVHEILIVKGVYDSQIVGFCNYNRIASVVPEYIWQILCTALVAITSQAFFTYRMWKFHGKGWFYWIVLVPVCSFELGGGLAFIAFGTIVPKASELVSRVPSDIFIAIQAVAAAADLLIAAGMVFLLIQSRERMLQGSRPMLDKLLILTINTGIWTALFAVSTFVALLASRDTLIYAALYFPLCPLYCNTVLANLNAREFLVERVTVPNRSVADTSLNVEPVFATCARCSIRSQSMCQPPSTVQTSEVHDKLINHEECEVSSRERAIKFEPESSL